MLTGEGGFMEGERKKVVMDGVGMSVARGV